MVLISWEEAAERLRQGESIAYPTDTVWGIGCIADDKERLINCLKKKGELRQMVSSVILPKKRIGVPFIEKDNIHFEHVLPGPYTFILPIHKDCPTKHCAGEENGKYSLGIRRPDLPALLDLVDNLDAPLLTTSLNFHGEPPCKTLEEAQVIADCMGIACVNAPEPTAGTASTILKWTEGNWKVIREGVGSVDAVLLKKDKENIEAGNTI